ncbi:MAG: ABC transporter ATP-binding protein [Planctomycetes bacterium]|nr:ABC transporter ATP-binding protein [Planctomycetota bacterium]MBI3836153.1 ABC transporter ATP-binding protein [Planctomycetota bacterium]
MNAALVDIRDAWKIYHVGEVQIPAVRGVSLKINRGEFLAITGPSGSGKSTFMHLLGCLDRMSSGSYQFEDEKVQELSRRQLARLRNRRIGFVFQSFNLLSRTTILDNVALPLIYQGIGLRERRRLAADMLNRVGLGDRLRHHTNQLSGGQQQRVAIARALVTRPPMLLADEPTGNLDTKTSVEIMTLFQQLNRDDGITVIVVTHELDIAAFARRHVAFRDGLIVVDEIREDSISLPAAGVEKRTVSAA